MYVYVHTYVLYYVYALNLRSARLALLPHAPADLNFKAEPKEIRRKTKGKPKENRRTTEGQP